MTGAEAAGTAAGTAIPVLPAAAAAVLPAPATLHGSVLPVLLLLAAVVPASACSCDWWRMLCKAAA